MTKTYTFQAKVWLWSGEAAWHFVSLPQDVTQEIDFYFAHLKKGWGSLPVMVTIGETTWKTSIFPDKKNSSYLLPIKADVRKKELIIEGSQLEIMITV